MSKFNLDKKLGELQKRFDDLSLSLSNPDVINDRAQYTRLSKEHAELSRVVALYQEKKALDTEVSENRELLHDPDEEVQTLAHEELKLLEENLEKVTHEIHVALLPKDPNDEKNTVVEIRAGTGGEEAALFAAELFRMYTRFAEGRNWKVDMLSQNVTGMGGFKEIIFLIEGKGAYSQLKYESGVHRVQRVPETESQGRIHTSAVTVAVLPEAEEVDVKIDATDLDIDVYRSSGPGGQHVNTTDSAVRITHKPTGIVVTCQDEKSQHKNKTKAMKVLRARLLDRMEQEKHDEIAEKRRDMVGSGDRSERIRTYNYPQNRVTDHRIGLTLYKLEAILQGELTQLIEPLNAYFETERMNSGFNRDDA